MFKFVFEVRGFCIESKILLPSSLRVPESARSQSTDMPTKKLNWYYDFIECTLHTILNGYYMDFSVNIYFCIFPCYCIVILETFFPLSFSFSSALFTLSAPFSLEFELFCSCGTFYRSAELMFIRDELRKQPKMYTMKLIYSFHSHN